MCLGSRAVSSSWQFRARAKLEPGSARLGSHFYEPARLVTTSITHYFLTLGTLCWPILLPRWEETLPLWRGAPNPATPRGGRSPALARRRSRRSESPESGCPSTSAGRPASLSSQDYLKTHIQEHVIHMAVVSLTYLVMWPPMFNFFACSITSFLDIFLVLETLSSCSSVETSSCSSLRPRNASHVLLGRLSTD